MGDYATTSRNREANNTPKSQVLPMDVRADCWFSRNLSGLDSSGGGAERVVMTAEVETFTLDAVDNERARRVKARRLDLGMSINKFAELSGLDRGTLTKLEEGSPATRETSFAAAESTLDRLEHEYGMDQPGLTEGGLVEFRLFDGEVVVKGPVSNLAELEGMVERLIERRRRERG